MLESVQWFYARSIGMKMDVIDLRTSTVSAMDPVAAIGSEEPDDFRFC